MQTPYLSAQPVDDFSLRTAGFKYSAALAASTDTTITVPGAAKRYKAIFKVAGTGAVWVAINQTAAIPAGTTFALTDSELVTEGQKVCREVISGDVLHFFTTTATTPVNVLLYTMTQNN